MEAKDLKQRLLEYREKAEAFESVRYGLSEIISDLARTTITPLVIKRLPEDYQISLRGTEVYSTAPHDRIPSKFELSLRLIHNNKPIFKPGERTSCLISSLVPFLRELAEEYGLERIGLDIEPVHIG